ncbi:hypothetical protein SERLA73DRAFT_80988 [Serpula lacrymans var. lacrymans S7.3]|uniref:Retrovirus-related Pol polyprotein from transposon TNT 1-94-like beta-barrel domain-containing protein n=1 Tax=Serpula lacrymans var. lacrymans (strain S7.3) TaxID=936435 RepID=F8QKK6_SERL3|nr:hypothetical protein SERLA73DRAFT_80988 [Serpula lacrymans var. lacrymans S7.3]
MYIFPSPLLNTFKLTLCRNPIRPKQQLLLTPEQHPTWSLTAPAYHVLHPPRTISFGDESSVNAIGIGTVILQATVGKKDYNIALSNVLLVPNFTRVKCL